MSTYHMLFMDIYVFAAGDRIQSIAQTGQTLPLARLTAQRNL